MLLVLLKEFFNLNEITESIRSLRVEFDFKNMLSFLAVGFSMSDKSRAP